MSVVTVMNDIIWDQKARIRHLESDRNLLLLHLEHAAQLLSGQKYPGAKPQLWPDTARQFQAAVDRIRKADTGDLNALTDESQSETGSAQASDNGSTGPAAGAQVETQEGAAPRIALLQRQGE
jgi:hypothetical protein